MSDRYKPGSRIASVWASFREGGASAAEATGNGLGLAANTLRSWIRTWSRENGATPPPRAVRPKATATEPKAATPPPGRREVRVSYSSRKAYLIEQGPQVSVIRWADTGDNQAISNKWLPEIPDVIETRRPISRGATKE